MDEKLKPMSGANESGANEQPDQQARGESGMGEPGVRRETPAAGVRSTSTEARQGATSGRVRKVLVVSTGLAAAAMLGTWWYFV